MATLVSIELETGTLTRYETGGEKPRATHRATIGHRVVFMPNVIFGFRNTPPDQFKLEPPKPDKGKAA